MARGYYTNSILRVIEYYIVLVVIKAFSSNTLAEIDIVYYLIRT